MLSFLIPLVLSFLVTLISITCFVIAFFKNRENDANKFVIIASLFASIGGFISLCNVDVIKPNIYPLDDELENYSNELEIIIDTNKLFETYFSLDGTDPRNGNIYEEPIVISETVTICARNKFLFWWSEVSKSKYIIEDEITTNGSHEDVTTDQSVFNDVTPDNFVLDESSANGTMPKGTAPKSIFISDEMKEILKSAQMITVGSSKNWIDNKLGSPFSSKLIDVTNEGRVRSHFDEEKNVEKLLECVYLFDIISMRIYYNTFDNSCEAFFITLMEDIAEVDLFLPKGYSFITSDRPLGEFAFTDIYGDPLNVYGYVSNGAGRIFYGEQYYYMGGGNYQYFYFAILDYGMLYSHEAFDYFISEIQLDIPPINKKDDYQLPSLLLQQRSKFYPNTYGISNLNHELTIDLIGSYNGFDSMSII